MVFLGKFDLNGIEKKFNQIADRFLSDDKIINDHIELKRNHTFRVYDEIMALAGSLNLNEEDRKIAGLIALFHDIGRFEQFYRYKTFNDKISVNHAEQSVLTLRQNGFFEGLPARWVEIIEYSILHHNIPSIPLIKDERLLLFTRLIRDADKLDIWRIIADDEMRRIIERSPEEDTYTIPDDIYECFRNSRPVLLSQAKSINDMRLVRISWVFDINFSFSFGKIKERDITGRIFSLLPGSPVLDEIRESTGRYIDKKLNLL